MIGHLLVVRTAEYVVNGLKRELTAKFVLALSLSKNQTVDHET